MHARLKKVLRIAGYTIGGLFVVVTGVGLCLPTTIHVERSVVVNATPQEIYPFIANFKTGWPEWSPFQGDEAHGKLQLQFSGPEQGAGAKQSWESAEMGDGTMTITKGDPATGVAFDLNLMHDTYRLNGALVCEPAQGGTKVTWMDDVSYGKNPYRRYLGVVVKKPLGDAFDKGLGALKTKVEAKAIARPAT